MTLAWKSGICTCGYKLRLATQGRKAEVEVDVWAVEFESLQNDGPPKTGDGLPRANCSVQQVRPPTNFCEPLPQLVGTMYHAQYAARS